MMTTIATLIRNSLRASIKVAGSEVRGFLGSLIWSSGINSTTSLSLFLKNSLPPVYPFPGVNTVWNFGDNISLLSIKNAACGVAVYCT